MERTIAEGVEQTAGYMARCAAEAGHLVVIPKISDSVGNWPQK